MAAVRVRAPCDIDPWAIEAELARTINTDPRLPMTVELSRAEDVRTQTTHGVHRHGYVALLSLTAEVPLRALRRGIRKAALRALQHRFGSAVTADVATELTDNEQAVLWCTLRGTPHRQH